MNKCSVPRGTRDIYYPEIEKWHYLEQKVRNFFQRFLYKEIRTPIFEHSDLFQRGIGDQTEVVQKEMYSFLDKGGRELTLRPENTASVVRAFIENNLGQEIFPLRFYYIGPMFRYDKPQKGRYRQFHQFGIEVFGDAGPEVDAEVIYSACQFLIEINIKDYTLCLNSVGCKDCRPAYLQELSVQAQKHSASLCFDCQRKIQTNPLRIFDCKNHSCIQVASQFPKITSYLCQDCHTHYNSVKEHLHLFNIEYVENPMLVRGLDYYNRTTFEIVSQKLGSQDAILGGGRYDSLFKELGGTDIPAIGFAAGMERIILHFDEVSLKPSKKTVFVAIQDSLYLKEAISLAMILWEKGVQTYIDYGSKNLKKQLKKSDRLKAMFTFILGEDEVKTGQISIKNMQIQQQVKIKKEELNQWLSQNL